MLTGKWWIDQKNMTDSRSALAVGTRSTFLAGLEPPAEHAILAAAQTRRIPAKHNVITGGEKSTHLFLLKRGHINYHHLTKQGESVLLGWLVPGDVIGLAALLKNPSAYMATAATTSDCELLVWEHSVIRKLVSRHPVLGENGLRLALGYLRTYVNRHIGLVTKTAEERLAETLLMLGERSGEVHSNGIEIRATNDQLGALADISPFTASRVLSDWADEGILSKKRGKVILQAPEALMVD
jgi:CRP/FNR family transcriptional regulator, nitrogen oxide reductase regulator